MHEFGVCNENTLHCGLVPDHPTGVIEKRASSRILLDQIKLA
jgi:hypothetical protein